MKTLDLEKLHYICNRLSNKESELSEEGIHIHLMECRSEYSEMDFEQFLEYYSFRLEKDNVVVFNDDVIPYASYSKDNFSYVPTILLSFDENRLNSWIETEVKLQLEKQERGKIQDKEDLKRKIELLQKQLSNL